MKESSVVKEKKYWLRLLKAFSLSNMEETRNAKSISEARNSVDLKKKVLWKFVKLIIMTEKYY